ncbi:MAG: 30S ribosomal protein S4 [Desulfobulbaceae bacterium]|nr:30S ribosomal protein S4 [Desulfobulbaceae bacterium]
MARYTGAVCRQCRRERLKLFLKGDRCYTDKCAFERRGFPPGQHGQARLRKFSDYAVQLREKQKVRRMYGVMEGQFRKTFQNADQIKGVTGEVLLALLEKRLDNAIFRCGFANSRRQARQIVKHDHVMVNGKKVNVPSYLLAVNDVITVRDKSRNVAVINDSLDSVARRGVPSWLEVDRATFRATVKSEPERQGITMPIQEQLIVELYSK